jgi:probable O-glycosylation ligase (exosortase A-associated)
MRDLLVFIATLAILSFCLRGAFSAYLVWGWSGLIAINTYLYGFMVAVPYSLMFAVIALILTMAKRDPEQSKFQPSGTVVLYFIFALHCILCASLAVPDLDRNWEICTNMLKTLLFCILMPMLVTSRFRIHAVVVMIVLGISFHSGLDGLKFIASGGSHHADGNSKMGDNNHFALTISMVLPLALYLFQYSARKWVRFGFISVMVLTTLAVVATRSRGGLMSMVALGGWIVIMSRRRGMSFLVVSAVAVLIGLSAPASWTAKMDTINHAAEDTSFMGRVTAWKRASAIAVDHPLFGGGFHAGQARSLFQQYRYKPGILGSVDTPDIGYPAASHSIYFEVLGDLGFLGLFIFLAIIVNSFITWREIKSLARNQGASSIWAADLADMLTATLVAFVVGGALLSAAYFELSYMVMMLLDVTKQQLLRDKLLLAQPPAKAV